MQDSIMRSIFTMLALIAITIIGLQVDVLEVEERVSVWFILSFLIAFITFLLFRRFITTPFLFFMAALFCLFSSAIIVRFIMYLRGYI